MKYVVLSILSIISLLTIQSTQAAQNKATPDQYFSALHWNRKPISVTEARSIWCNTTNARINCEDLQTFRLLYSKHELNRQRKQSQLASAAKEAAAKRQQAKQQEANKQYLQWMSKLSNREMMIRNSYHN